MKIVYMGVEILKLGCADYYFGQMFYLVTSF